MKICGERIRGEVFDLSMIDSSGQLFLSSHKKYRKTPYSQQENFSTYPQDPNSD
jgi:hypothetical protein